MPVKKKETLSVIVGIIMLKLFSTKTPSTIEHYSVFSQLIDLLYEIIKSQMKDCRNIKVYLKSSKQVTVSNVWRK